MSKLTDMIMRALSGSHKEPPSLDDLLDKSDAIFLEVASSAVSPAVNSKRRHPFSLGSPFDRMSGSQLARMVPTMVREQVSFQRSMHLAKRHIPVTPRSADDHVSSDVAARLKDWGAAEFGFIRVPAHVVFRDLVAPLPNAIVFTGEMDRAIMESAPSYEGLREVADAYARTGTIANRLTKYLRARGYNAIPGHSLGGTVDYPLLAELAELGKIGRNGLLISQTYGGSQRIAVVFTDMEGLRLHEEEDYSWVMDFCHTCGKCIAACPAKAVYDEFREDESGQLSSTDGNACLPYFGANWGCSICVGVCPFTRTDYFRIKGSWEKRKARTIGASRTSSAPEFARHVS